MLKLNSINRTILFFSVFIGLLFIPKHGFTQVIHSGSLNCLVSANGFKSITLGQDAGSLISQANYLDNDSRPDVDSCFSYALQNHDLLNIDSNLTLDMVGVRTYKNKVVNIYLFFDEKDAYKVLSNFLQTYGQFTDRPVQYANIYRWDTSSISLSLSYNSDVDKGVAVFTFKPLESTIANTHKQKPAVLNLQANNTKQ